MLAPGHCCSAYFTLAMYMVEVQPAIGACDRDKVAGRSWREDPLDDPATTRRVHSLTRLRDGAIDLHRRRRSCEFPNGAEPARYLVGVGGDGPIHGNRGQDAGQPGARPSGTGWPAADQRTTRLHLVPPGTGRPMSCRDARASRWHAPILTRPGMSRRMYEGIGL